MRYVADDLYDDEEKIARRREYLQGETCTCGKYKPEGYGRCGDCEEYMILEEKRLNPPAREVEEKH